MHDLFVRVFHSSSWHVTFVIVSHFRFTESNFNTREQEEKKTQRQRKLNRNGVVICVDTTATIDRRK